MNILNRQRMIEWVSWQRGVVDEIRTEFRDLFSAIDDQDIDWDAWLPLYLEGCTPRRAVDKAFVRYH
jgi:hypothetical protein